MPSLSQPATFPQELDKATSAICRHKVASDAIAPEDDRRRRSLAPKRYQA